MISEFSSPATPDPTAVTEKVKTTRYKIIVKDLLNIVTTIM